jgi:hypothetical protein
MQRIFQAAAWLLAGIIVVQSYLDVKKTISRSIRPNLSLSTIIASVLAPMEQLNRKASLLQATHVIHCVNAHVVILVAEGMSPANWVGDSEIFMSRGKI